MPNRASCSLDGQSGGLQGGYGLPSTHSKLISAAVGFLLVLILPLLLPALISPEISFSQSNQTPLPESIEQTPPDNYAFVVKRGDNLSLIVRRSLQLYDKANKDITLTPPQLIYAETKIVKAIGQRNLILPGEKISIPTNKITNFAAMSQKLSTEMMKQWEVYATRANFNLKNIEPINTNNETNKDPGSETIQPRLTSGDFNAESVNDTPSPNSTWYWWFVAIGLLLLILYFILQQRAHTND